MIAKKPRTNQTDGVRIKPSLADGVRIKPSPAGPRRASRDVLRLKGRSTDSDAVIARRLEEAAQDIGHWNEFEYVVINDRFDAAVEDLLAIVGGRGDRLKAARPEVQTLARELLAS